MREYLFVYGTLLPGKEPPTVASVVKRLRPIGEAYVRGRLYDFGEYPGAIVDSRAATRIKGFLYEVPKDPTILRRLDRYEGFDPNDPSGSLFVRRRRQVMRDGKKLRSWVYEYNRSPRAVHS